MHYLYRFYFLFSSYVTQLIAATGAAFYMETGEVLYVVIPVILAALSVVPYLLFWIFSKNHPGCMIGALVLFSIDSVIFLIDFVALLLMGDLSFIIDLVFRIWALVSLIKAVKYGFESKNLGNAAEAVPPAGFYEGDMVLEENNEREMMTEQNENAMISRQVTLVRPKRFAAMAVQFPCFADGQLVGTLVNGKTLTLMLDGNAHELIVQVPNGTAMCGVSVPAGAEHRTYEVNIKMGAFAPSLTAVEKPFPPITQ